MNKLSSTIKKVSEKFKGLSRGRKIAFGVLFVSFIVATIYLTITVNKTKYEVLFSDLSATDSGAVIKKLDDDKIDYKIEGKSILVPYQQVDSLRMKMYSDVQFTDGSPGWELFNSSGMVATDFENKVKYQRALQGQMERMIKSFDEVKDCIVNLVLPEETAFVRETAPAQAAVAIKLKPGVKELSKSQVKAIVALLTGGVKNLPKENVQIAVNDMVLATDGLFDDEKNGIISTDKQLQIKKQYEEDIKNKILSILEPTYKNGFRVAVTVDMNFDQKRAESTDYKEGVKVSEKQILNTTNTGDTNASSSPVDNNFTPSIDEGNNNATSKHSEVTYNYDVPQIRKTNIEAPGKIEKINVSLTVDESKGILDDKTKIKIRNTVASIIGFNMDRGDTISIEGFNFTGQGSELITNAVNDLKDMQKITERQKIEKQIAYGFGAVLVLFLIFLFIKKLDRSNLDKFEGLDVVIGDNIEPKLEPQFEPVNLEVDDEQAHIAKEVKKYAKDKPEQVADIVKSWLSEDEG